MVGLLEMKLLCCWLVVAGLLSVVGSYELTFELPDNEVQCFFEEIKKDTDCTIEFQVVTGGQYDVGKVIFLRQVYFATV